MQYSRPLLTFAFVKSALETTGDFAQGLMPLFAPIIRRNAHTDFDAKKFADEVNEYYGIKMHPYVADDWRDRLVKEGYLHAVERDGLIERYINLNPDVQEDGEYQAKCEALLDEFVNYVEDEFEKHRLTVEKAIIENAIYSRLKSMEFISILNKKDKSSIPSKTLELPRETPESDETEKIDPLETKFDVACAAFALNLRNDDLEKFNLLSEIAGGALISEVVLGLRVPPRIGQEANGLMVFIDGPLALDALNVADEEEYEFAEMLLLNLKNMGAVLCIFRRSVDEIERILYSVTKKRREGEYVRGTIGSRLQTDTFAVTRLMELSKNLEDGLRERGIRIVNFDEKFPELYKYFPQSKESDLVSRIRQFRELTARETDARTLANVMRFVMSEPKKSNVFTNKAIFLTKNAGIVRQGTRYFVREHALSDEQAPPFITDRYMAGLLFVAQGGKGQDIPAKKLIANCAAAIAPRQDVVTRMLTVLDQIDDKVAPEFEALMTEKRCSYYLMESSLGDADIITKENALEIVEGVRRATSEDIAREKELEKSQALTEQEERFRREQEHTSEERRKEFERANEKLKETLGRLGEAEAQRDVATGKVRALGGDLAASHEEASKLERQLLQPCIDTGIRAGYWLAAKIYFSIALPLGIFGKMAEPFMGLIQSEFWKWIVSFAVTVVLVAGLGLMQFWVFPDRLFGKRIRAVRDIALRRRAVKLGLVPTLEKYVVDWERKTLVRRKN